MLIVTHTECHISALYAEYHNAECLYTECRHTVCHVAVYCILLVKQWPGENTLAYLSKALVTKSLKNGTSEART
jgi:hypothetical protein